ncbi:hypothetical protein B9Z51_08610 [Limnohabitans sp. T6-5]|uniref:tail fiber assembly protein n=1 Tax=Limnohabitans sp. T6-5 TaxID=1100724 RepID=UPI000D346E30|nr:tail fiber assembly protein [Limnohabitans sp. T6-5]PUE08985.1 hypothetical protein B9Z51_08610 [Limnohabitans sp. T6-5]
MNQYIYFFDDSGRCICKMALQNRSENFINELVLHQGAADWAQSNMDIDAKLARKVGGVLVQTEPQPLPIEEQKDKIRFERLMRLKASEWTDTASAPERLGPELYAAWQTYRQALRDVTDQPGFPTDVVWPVAPS